MNMWDYPPTTFRVIIILCIIIFLTIEASNAQPIILIRRPRGESPLKCHRPVWMNGRIQRNPAVRVDINRDLIAVDERKIRRLLPYG